MAGEKVKAVAVFIYAVAMFAAILMFSAMLGACQPMPTVPNPVPKPIEQPIALSWESDAPSRSAWSRLLIERIDLAVYAKAKDLKSFCPKYSILDDNLKLKTVSELWVAIARYESDWNPKSASVDVGSKDKKDTWSVGLFQMSVVDQVNYGLKFGYSYADLIMAGPNIHLALAIMEKQIVKRGLIVVPSNPYWAVIYDGRYSKIPQIKALVLKAVPTCK